MVTPKRVIETTPLVVARIKQLERAQRAPERMRETASKAMPTPRIERRRDPSL
jgi:hypothetical protein